MQEAVDTLLGIDAPTASDKNTKNIKCIYAYSGNAPSEARVAAYGAGTAALDGQKEFDDDQIEKFLRKIKKSKNNFLRPEKLIAFCRMV